VSDGFNAVFRQTHVLNKGDRGFALVDDFSVSLAEEQ